MEIIELKIDEDNELAFNVMIEGARGSKAKIRFVIEDNDMSLSFPGQASGSEVKVEIPSLKKVMKEGTYKGKLEVITEDRFFEPLKFDIDLKQALKVEAAVITENKKKNNSGITVTATSTVKPVNKPIKKQTVSKKSKLTETTAKLAQKYNISESDVRKYIKDILGKRS